MKKIVCLLLCILMSSVLLIGCGFFQHNYERDYGQIIATIKSIKDEDVTGLKTVLDASGMPVRDVNGEIVKESVSTKYVSKKIDIYKSQLVNYVRYYLNDDLNNAGTVNASIVESNVNKYLDRLISTELLLIEADKLLDAGIIYWTKEDVESIQRGVYTSISDEIFNYKNALLKADEQPELPVREADPAVDETTYPVKPVEEDDDEIFSPAYYINPPAADERGYQWFDDWYLEDEWYIEDESYKNAYPGMYGGSLKDRSLAIEAFSNYLADMIEKSESIIGVTSEQKKIIKNEIKEINRIKDSEGLPYVYPYIGKTLMFKLMLGNSHIKNQKLTKLEGYITRELTTVDQVDITEYYNNLLKSQKERFTVRSNYDTAITNKETILYTPSDRYVFVKHILLPFSDEQKAELDRIKAREGKNEDRIKELRAALARQITVYKHKDGEDDLSRKYTVSEVTNIVTAEMTRLKNNPKKAERAFDDFIYDFNTDPGIFGNEKGYAVVYKLEDGEKETYMTEFAEAARAFRSEGYKIGEIYYDEELTDERGNPVPYIVTDYGIHIMYYALDPKAGEVKGLQSYVTPAEYSYINDLMKDARLTQARADAYSTWEMRYIKEQKNKSVNAKDKLVDKYIKEVKKDVGI